LPAGPPKRGGLRCLAEQPNRDHDPLLRSLYVAGLNASYSMFKEFPGGFKGLMAGPDLRLSAAHLLP